MGWLLLPALLESVKDDLANVVARDVAGLVGASVADVNGLAVAIELETVNGEVLSFWSFAGDLTSLAWRGGLDFLLAPRPEEQISQEAIWNEN